MAHSDGLRRADDKLERRDPGAGGMTCHDRNGTGSPMATIGRAASQKGGRNSVEQLETTSQNSGSATDNAGENVWSNSNYIKPHPTPNGWAPRKAPPTPSGHQREVMRPRIWGGGRLYYHAECGVQRRPRYRMTRLRRPWRGSRWRWKRSSSPRRGDGRSMRPRRGADRMFFFFVLSFCFSLLAGRGAPLGLLDSAVAFFCL